MLLSASAPSHYVRVYLFSCSLEHNTLLNGKKGSCFIWCVSPCPFSPAYFCLSSLAGLRRCRLGLGHAVRGQTVFLVRVENMLPVYSAARDVDAMGCRNRASPTLLCSERCTAPPIHGRVRCSKSGLPTK